LAQGAKLSYSKRQTETSKRVYQSADERTLHYVSIPSRQRTARVVKSGSEQEPERENAGTEYNHSNQMVARIQLSKQVTAPHLTYTKSVKTDLSIKLVNSDGWQRSLTKVLMF